MGAPKIPKTLGKAWRSLDDPFAFPMTFLTIDVERTFLGFLEMGVRFGHVTKRMKEATVEDYSSLFLEELSNDARVSGLSQPERKRVLDGWLRATVLKFEKSGLDKKGGRRLAIPRPLHLGVIRSGLPSRLLYLVRYSDVWTYYSAIKAIEETLSERAGGDQHISPERFLSNLLMKRLGQGLELDVEYKSNYDEPRYDERTPIDVNTLLAFRVLSKFTSARPGDPDLPESESWPSKPWSPEKRKNSKQPSGFADYPVRNGNGLRPIEQLVISSSSYSEIGIDIVNLLSCYGGLEGSELTQHCLALLSFRLYRAPLSAAEDVRNLVSNPEKHRDEEAEPTNLIYCDFSDGRDIQSVALAKKAVTRDLEMHRLFMKDRYYLRVLEWVGQLQNQELRNELAVLKRSNLRAYFARLLELRSDAQMTMAARLKLQEFQSAIASGVEGEEESTSQWQELLMEWNLIGLNEIEQLTQILLTASLPGGRAPAQIEQWCWTTGGMSNEPPHRPYALLAGSVKHRSTWRYAPTDQLLTALLLGCFVSGRPGEDLTVPEMRFGELIDAMKTRYGICIDVPPGEFSDSESLRTAERNRGYFAQKLQMLGCFDGLSDDSHFQMVRRPR